MRYQGLIKRVFYTNVGVEAKDLNEARRKVREMAEVMPPDVYDYEDPTFLYVKEWDAKGFGGYSDYIERDKKKSEG